jgi:hypothetical protein
MNPIEMSQQKGKGPAAPPPANVPMPCSDRADVVRSLRNNWGEGFEARFVGSHNAHPKPSSNDELPHDGPSMAAEDSMNHWPMEVLKGLEKLSRIEGTRDQRGVQVVQSALSLAVRSRNPQGTPDWYLQPEDIDKAWRTCSEDLEHRRQVPLVIDHNYAQPIAHDRSISQHGESTLSVPQDRQTQRQHDGLVACHGHTLGFHKTHGWYHGPYSGRELLLAYGTSPICGYVVDESTGEECGFTPKMTGPSQSRALRAHLTRKHKVKAIVNREQRDSASQIRIKEQLLGRYFRDGQFENTRFRSLDYAGRREEIRSEYMTNVPEHVPQAPTPSLSNMGPAPNVPSVAPTMPPFPGPTRVSIDRSPVTPMPPPHTQFALPTPHATPPQGYGLTPRVRSSETVLRGEASPLETGSRPNHPTSESRVVTPRNLQTPPVMSSAR